MRFGAARDEDLWAGIEDSSIELERYGYDPFAHEHDHHVHCLHHTVGGLFLSRHPLGWGADDCGRAGSDGGDRL